jgi:alpha-L-fucosidase 2
MTSPDLFLWYDKPAAEWVEALPVGNGRLGAMVFGGVGHERLQLNEDTLYAGGPYQQVNPDALDHLAEVRALLFAERYAEAQALADRHLMSVPLKQMPYQPAVDLLIDMPGEAAASRYRRALDLDQAIASTRFERDGLGVTREVFATAADGILVVRISASAPLPMLRLSLTSLNAGTLSVPDTATLRFSGRNRAAYGIEGRLSFVAEARVHSDGAVSSVADAIEITGARDVVVLVDIATSYRRFDDVGGDPLTAVTRRLDAAELHDADALRRRHVAEHQALFRRLSIDLGHTEAEALSTDRRIAANETVADPALAALYVQYGRYLMLASSRPGTQPANLQGIWNDLVEPPWDSKYTANINLQMNYWLADPANLSECMEPLIRLVEDVAITGAETAKRQYGAPGWVLHHNTDLWRATGPIDGAQWGLWPTGGAWLIAQLWDHIGHSGDTALIERLYPVMVGCAEFIAHVLVPLPGTDLLVTAPSLSPENVHPHGAALCYGPAMDSQIIRDLFDAVIAAGETLGRDTELCSRLAGLRARLPTDRIGAGGHLQEWMEDWDMDVPEIHHRHVSHLYALYPSQQIGIDTTPALAAAARRSLDIRGDDATGWGIGWRINLWARLRDGERANAIVQRLLSPERTYPNMFDAHPPFQIDGNFGGAAGILEMLVQSRPGEITLLPALPSAWPAGSLKGVKARGNVLVDMSWSDGRPESVRMRSGTAQIVDVRHGDQTVRLELGPDWREVLIG